MRVYEMIAVQLVQPFFQQEITLFVLREIERKVSILSTASSCSAAALGRRQNRQIVLASMLGLGKRGKAEQPRYLLKGLGVSTRRGLPEEMREAVSENLAE